MRSRYITGLFLALSLTLLAAGCAEDRDADTRPVVVVQVSPMTQDYLLSVEEQCPDINIKWYFSTQASPDLYQHMETTPDILNRSNYFFNSSTSHLRDISEEPVINDYSRNIIDYFTESDGSLYWLPCIGAGFGIIANTALFEKYGIDYPTDYKSLVKADAEFKKHGIDGISWGMGKAWAYQTFLVAQLLSADIFNSYEGFRWRRDYMDSLLSGGSYVVDDFLWPEVFRRFRDALDCGLIDDSDLSVGNVDASAHFIGGNAAMLVCATTNVSGYDFDSVILPAFDMQGDSWVPMSLAQSYAVSASVPDERMDDVMKVLRALRSSASVKAYDDSRGGVLPLNNDVSILNGKLSPLKEVIRKGYTCITFNENGGGLSNAFYDAVHTMASGGLAVEDACAYLQERTLHYREEQQVTVININRDDPDHLAFVSEVSWPMVADRYHNNPTNSVLANTALAAVNEMGGRQFDILLCSEVVGGEPITKGPYWYDSEGNVSFASRLMYLYNNGRSVYPVRMTVGELIRWINTSFRVFYRVDDGLPVMAGASYVVDKYPEGLSDDDLPFTPNPVNAGNVANLDNYPQRYLCRAIVRDGVELPEDMELDIALSRECAFYMTSLDSGSPSGWTGLERPISVTLPDGRVLDHLSVFTIEWLTAGHGFSEPTRYLYLNETPQMP